jgi:hypothetical protein
VQRRRSLPIAAQTPESRGLYRSSWLDRASHPLRGDKARGTRNESRSLHKYATELGVDATARPILNLQASATRFASTRRLRDLRCLCSDVFALQRAKECLRFLEADANIAGLCDIAAASNYQY